jgi:hypothetical protein
VNLDALMEKASKASFDGRSARTHRWSPLFPVYQKLRSRGATCAEAVDWLVREGLIPRDGAAKALKSFHVTTYNRNKKAKNA